MAHFCFQRTVAGLMFICLMIWTLPAYAGELATLTTSTGASNHRFGFAVAISGDTIVVGAPSANNGKGAAYVFVKPAGGWTTMETPTATLTDSALTENAELGSAVAISGNTIVIGAPGAKIDNRSNQGQVAVFVKPGSGWADTATPTARLTDGNGAANDQFGFAVAIDGDDVVIGTPDASQKKGKVHVFEKPGAGWNTSATPTAILTEKDSAANDRFGFTVAISGDTIVTGAYGHNIGGKTDQGSAYVFVSPGGNWVSSDTPTAKLTASDGKKSDQFGNSVAVDGSTVVVAAWLKDVGSQSDQGAAYLFLKPGGGWTNMTESAILLASDGRNSDTFGVWVDIKSNKVIVGANLDDDGANRNEGSVYVFAKPLPGWTSMTETAKLTAAQPRAGDTFGFATAISGDLVVAGAPNHDVGSNTQQGSASVFNTATLAPAVGALLPTAEIGAGYNATIAISGGNPPFVVSDNGTLPPGLSVDNNGIVSGTPAVDAKSGSVTFVVTDQNNATATKTVNLTIIKPVTVATKTLARGRVGKNYKARLKAKAGKGPYTWSLAAGALPAGLSIDNDIDAITGVPTTAASTPFDFTIRVTDGLGGVATNVLSITVNP
jgi:FG-GAP repeat/Putative Ig domain